MTPERISQLIKRRNKLTSKRSLNRPALDEIDAKLREVPAGERNDVDLLLGRACATLPDRAVYGAIAAVLDKHAEAAQKWSSDEQRAEWQALGEHEAGALADDKMNEWYEYRLTHMPASDDPINAALIAACNEHNVKAFEWRRTHPDWRTQR